MQSQRQNQRGRDRGEEEEARPPEPAAVPRPPARVDEDQADDEGYPQQIERIQLPGRGVAERGQHAAYGQGEAWRVEDQPLAEGEQDAQQPEEERIAEAR